MEAGEWRDPGSFTTEKFHLDRDTNVRAGDSLQGPQRGEGEDFSRAVSVS